MSELAFRKDDHEVTNTEQSDSPAKAKSGRGPKATSNVTAAPLEFRNVVKRYPGAAGAAINDLSFRVPAGEVCVLVGPSGCGKTTAMRLVNRMIDMTGGSILIDEKTIGERQPAELRREIGYVIQHVGLFPHLTINNNISTVPKLLGWDRKRMADRCEELLELVGLPAEMGRRYPSQLSGGQRQRVGVARALAADPPLMLMDEPFGAIDPINRERLQNEFLRLQREIRKTIVFVTHDIDEAIKMGDRIAILREGGELVQFDTPDRILAAPANDFVAQFVGADRGLKRLALTRLDEIDLKPSAEDAGQQTISAKASLREALSLMMIEDPSGGRSRPRGQPAGLCDHRAAQPEPAPGPRRDRHSGRLMSSSAAATTAGPPVIPNFGSTSSCVRNNDTFCWPWFKAHWSTTFEPALMDHIRLTLIAVSIGFAISFVLAIAAHRYRWLTTPITLIGSLLYTIPSLAAFAILVSITGINDYTVELPLISYTLLILFTNTLAGLTGVSPDVVDAARGSGLTRGRF